MDKGKLKDKAIAIKPRENSGSMASNRFDFQRNWAICKILELHTKPGDYLVSFEYHDDIIVFDSSSDPDKISFYQVKTKDDGQGHWTINALLHRKKGEKQLLNSFLGKLYQNVINFKDHVESLNFVTNAKINGKLAGSKKCQDSQQFCCADLDTKELTNIVDKLKDEHSLADLGKFKDIMFFKLGELSITQHDQLTKAALADFIDSKFPGQNYQIVPLYRSIFDEVRRKSNVEEVITDFETLKKKKSISREDFEKHLQVVTRSSSVAETISSIESRLNAEKVSFVFTKAFRRYAKQFEIDRMNHANRSFKSVVEQSKSIVDTNTCNADSLMVTLDCLMAEVRKTIASASIVEDDYLKTILLFHLYE